MCLFLKVLCVGLLSIVATFPSDTHLVFPGLKKTKGTITKIDIFSGICDF